jgi:hypothetical protein
MTRSEKKERERFYASQWLLRRRIAARLEDHEHPDFVVQYGAERLGIEIVEYHGGTLGRGGSKGRQVEASWDALRDYSDDFRERTPDIDRVGVRLHFKEYRMPPPRSFEDFCNAVAELVRKSGRVVDKVKLAVKLDPVLHPLLADYLIGVELFGRSYWSHWEWPAYMNGSIGTTDEELHAVVADKLATYNAPAGINSSHLVIVGGGPALTRIAAPVSALHLSTYSKLNRALNNGPFASVATLCLRDFIWSKDEGWKDFPAYE